MIINILLIVLILFFICIHLFLGLSAYWLADIDFCMDNKLLKLFIILGGFLSCVICIIISVVHTIIED